MPQSVTARSNGVRRSTGHHQVSQHAPAEHVVLVYAITDDLKPEQLTGLTGVGGGSGIYDNRGRFGYAGIQAQF